MNQRSVVQRLGHLLGRLGHHDSIDALFEAVSQGPVLPWIELEPAQASDPDFAPEPIERDELWHVIVRRSPEPDA